MKIMTALRRRMPLTRALWLTVGMVLVGCAVRMAAQDSRFTIVALPDTQCYVDHNNQKAAGLSFDTADQLFA
jgi:hypothetical protein